MPQQRVRFTSEILDGGTGPIFRVTSVDAPDMPAEGNSATAAWNVMLKVLRATIFLSGSLPLSHASGFMLQLQRVNDALEKHERRNVISVSGPEMYGFSNPQVRRVRESATDKRIALFFIVT